ncbi:putative cytosol aminopeptidase [Bacilli bacterium]|nr:putative cytosol aminopeptidase [Bacilli bacterium]
MSSVPGGFNEVKAEKSVSSSASKSGVDITFVKNANVEAKGALISFYTEEFLEKNKNFFAGHDFKAGFGETLLTVNSRGNIVVFMGLGKNADNVKLEQVGWDAFEYIKNNKFKSVVLSLNDGKDSGNDEKIFSVVRGIELSNYSFDKYFSEDKKQEAKPALNKLAVVVKNEEEVKAKYKDFILLRDNVFLVRDLVNEPSNVINPDSYSKLCKEMEKYGLEVEVIGEKEMKKLGMNSLLAVGQGSAFESKLVVLKWKGLPKFENPVALVGKGVTFDSGGLSLKPEEYMLDMKQDMAGSATVVGTLKLLAERKAKVNAVGVIGLVENMPSGEAVKPDDIVKSMSGQTIEILNTDAEGRLVLADLLYYTVTKYNPAVVIDLATLTGAIIRAIGTYKYGVFTRNDELAKEINKASEATGEYSWRMPLGELGCNYDRAMNSNVADVKNLGKGAGAVTAAQFLQRFTNKHPKWAHLDIAGVAFMSDERGYFVNSGATGCPVRMLDNLIRNNYEK